MPERPAPTISTSRCSGDPVGHGGILADWLVSQCDVAHGAPSSGPESQHMGVLGVDAALEHVEVGALDGLEALAGTSSSQPPVHSQNGCQASATRSSRPAAPQSAERLTTRSGAKKKVGVGPGSSPAAGAELLPVGGPTAMLWASWSPKCAWTARRTSPSPETST